MTPEKPGTWQKLQNIDRRILYLILVVVTTVPLWLKVPIPVVTDNYSNALYAEIANIPEGKTVFIQSDWTLSTRGESAGHLEAMLRILMEHKTKFVIFSLGDPQAPGVFRNTLRTINEERKSKGLTSYQVYDDYLDLGYFPNAEGTLQAIGGDVRKVFDKKRVRDTKGVEHAVFDSPVLKSVNSVGDVGAYIVITASNTIDRAVERISSQTRLSAMVTGVIGPSTLPWFQAGQLKGVAIGLKGVYDIEYLMENGLNVEGQNAVHWADKPDVKAEPIKNGVRLDRGAKYYLSFHGAILLLIVAVIVGNVAMAMGRKAGRAA